MAEKRATTPREWALAIAGGLGFALVLIAVARPDMFASDDAPAIVPVATMAPPPSAAPQPPNIPPAPPSPPSQTLLRGVLLPRAAIFEDEAGRQRLVRIGQPLRPGTAILASLTPRSATLRTPNGSLQTLMLDGTAAPPSEAAAPAPTGAALKATPASLRATSNDYRLALQPLRSGGGDVRGWTVRDPAAVPLFTLAGLRPGDVLLAINDQPLFSEEKIIDLPGEIAGAYAVKLEYSRDGRKTTTTVQLAR